MAGIKKIVKHGNTLRLILGYFVNGKPITEGMCEEMEFSIGSLKFYLSQDDIVWSALDNGYEVRMTQEQTFGFPDVVPYQLRVKVDGEVGGSDVEYLDIGQTISQEVL